MLPPQISIPSKTQEVPFSPLNEKNIRLFVKRDDLIHPDISGNKWRKLSLNLEQARHRGNDTILTFGGAFSNHISATAMAARLLGFKSVGVIRGQDADENNPTLKFARENGMHLHFITREAYRNVNSWDFKEELRSNFGSFYSIPQGGANFYGVQGCTSIVKEITIPVDKIFVSCGTGTTLSGMIMGNTTDVEITGVSALKGGNFLMEDVRKNLMDVYKDDETVNEVLSQVKLETQYHFGGFAKMKPELLSFMRMFYAETGIKLDPIYTAKTAFAMKKLAEKRPNELPENWILIHTGGLQGIEVMEKVLGESIY